MPARLTVLGGINLGFAMHAERLPGPGESAPLLDLELVPAGEGAYQALAAGRLGAQVTLLGCVGRDSYGEVLRRRLCREGINVKYVATDSEQGTGMAFTMLAEGSPRTLLLPGANLQYSPDHVEAAHRAFERAQWLLLSLSTPEETAIRAMQIAADCEVPVVLQARPLGKKPPQLWNRAAVVVADLPTVGRLAHKPAEDPAQGAVAAQRLLTRGVEHVCILLGAEGCLLCDAAGPRRLPAFAVPVVDSSGAEEAFAAALTAQLALEQPVEAAATYALAAAALTAGGRGAATALPSAEAVEALLKKVRRAATPVVEPL